MSSNFNEFQRKVKNRQFSIDNSWRGDGQLSQGLSEPVGLSQQGWGRLAFNLSEADDCKFCDGYFPIYSHRKILGPVIVFFKKAIRKLLKIFFGWYLSPIYARQTSFNEKILNAVSLERDILLTLDAKITDLLRKVDNLSTGDDSFYHSFEEKFRGSREEIKGRLQVYVPTVKEHLPDWREGRFIDVGSGRGEWLDILRENGAVDYVGVDLNVQQNAICEGLGHKMVCEDCIKYLAEQPNESVDLISGFHIVEHLCMSDLMELLKQSYRVLKKGGMILFETPNPKNLVVGANTFYIDPSHKRPLDPRMMEFLVQWCGFINTACIDVNSHPDWAGVTGTSKNEENREIIEKINQLCWLAYGPQDYAVFAVKE